ncbi:MAG: DUF6261 family protein [Paludibacter sp.]
MKYRSKINRVNNETRAILALRIIDTVLKSGIEAAKVSKRFMQLVDVNGRYQLAGKATDSEQVKSEVDALFALRYSKFSDIYAYIEGLLASPDAEMKAAAVLLFQQINRYGRNFNRMKISDQSIRYIRIIEALKKAECAAPLTKTLLTASVNSLDQVQLDYEELYMGHGDTSAIKIAPSSVSAELNDALKLYMDEVNLMASVNDLEEWKTLCINLQQRFDEVNVNTIRKSKTDAVDKKTDATTATDATTPTTGATAAA